jgi:hypothetical protein
MAFSASEMILMADGRGHKLYHYLTTDADTAIDDSGYFNAFASQLDVGDVIVAIKVDDVDAPTSATGASLHVVVGNDGSVVDTSNTLYGAFSNSD